MPGAETGDRRQGADGAERGRFAYQYGRSGAYSSDGWGLYN